MKSLAADRLYNALKNGVYPHALLFCGGSESARDEAEKSAARLLLCMSDTQKPCGVCQACALLNEDAHPDHIVLEAPEGKRSIPVDDIRALIAALGRRPVFDTHVAYIKQAHTMLPPAQNALLKMLEEPPEDTVIILGGNLSGLLPTVLSRCMKLRLPDEQPEQLDGAARAAADAIYNGAAPLSTADFYNSFNKTGGSAQTARMALSAVLELQADYLLQLAAGDKSKTGRCLWSAMALINAKKRLLQNANVALTIDAMLIELAGCQSKP